MFESLVKEIKNHKTIIIHRHENPDGDALGSQFGLKRFIELNFSKKRVYAVGKDDANYLKPLFPKPQQIKDIVYKNSLVIIIDTANVERISSNILWNLANKTIKIDHHPPKNNFANINIIDTKASSSSEIIASLFFSNKSYKIDSKAASYIYLGMITDTNRFMFESVTSKSLGLAAKIYDVGIKKEIKKIYDILYSRPLNEVRFIGYLLQNYKVDKKISYFVAPKNIHKKFNLDYSVVSSAVNNLLSSKNIHYAAYASFDSENKSWKISLRSRAKKVNQICEEFGGGGHKHACGIKLEKIELFSKIIERLKNIDEYKSKHKN